MRLTPGRRRRVRFYAGKAAGDPQRLGVPQARGVVTATECGSHAVVDAEIGGVSGKGAGEQALARKLYARLELQSLVLADRNFDNWEQGPGAVRQAPAPALRWRVKAYGDAVLIEALPDGSRPPGAGSSKVTGRARERLIEAAKAGQDLDPGKAPPSSVIKHQVPDRDGGGNAQPIADHHHHHLPVQAPAAVRAKAGPPALGAPNRE